MSEAGDFELFGAPAAKEHDEKADEQFREEMKQAQKALIQLKKEEGQAKADDDQLAKIIVAFLGQSGNTDLFLLISRAVAQNIPSQLILAVISLIDKQASEEITRLLHGSHGHIEHLNALAVFQGQDLNALPPENKKRIDEWVNSMRNIALSKPHRTLESLVIQKREGDGVVREVSPIIIQLASFILRNYFAEKAIPSDFSQLHEFMQVVFVEIVKETEKQIAGQKKIS